LGRVDKSQFFGRAHGQGVTALEYAQIEIDRAQPAALNTLISINPQHRFKIEVLNTQ
jgi:hypothetical protein